MSEYLLGDASEELARLGFQHEVWSTTTTSLWDRAGFALGHRIADLGCGPGFATLPLARRVRETGEVWAVDASGSALAELNRRAEGVVQVKTHHVSLEDIELPAAHFDGLFARWVFCFLRDPEALIAKAARALRPGGTFAVLDYFRYDALELAPPVEVTPRVLEAVMRSWSDSGGDLNVGGRLPALLEAAGLEVMDVRPIVHCARPGTALWSWPATFFAGFLDGLVDKSLLSAEDADAFRDALSGHEQTPGAFMLTPPVIAIVARKR